MSKGGTVYLLTENGDCDVYKIGVTRGTIKNRLKKLQTGNANPLVCVKSFYSSRPYKLEKMLHGYFNNERMEGEWFLLDKNQVSQFTPLCEKYEHIIELLKDNPFF